MVATATTRVSASLGAVGTLRLNMLPVVFPNEIQKDVVYSLPYSDELWEDIRGRAQGGKTFHSYRYSDRIYLWPHSGEEMPADLDLGRATTHLASTLASAIVAFAVREAVVDRLMDHMEFERVGRTIEGQVRLFRRRFNLAAQALADLATAAGKTIGPETGMFPYIAVQAMPFGDRDHPGQVALVLDAGLVNRLDIPLADLAHAGVDLDGMPVVWAHADDCHCGFEGSHGPAGKITGGDASASVMVAVAGETRTVASRCLRPRVSRHELDRYFGDYLGDDGNVERLIREKVVALHDPETQWKMLEETRQKLSPITIFSSTQITLGPPFTADAEGANGVTLLPALPEPTLNFRYGTPTLFQNAAVGLLKHGPYDSGSTNRMSKVKAVILHPAAFRGDAERLRKALVTGVPGSYGFPGLAARYELEDLAVDLRSFAGSASGDYREAAHEATHPAPDGSRPDVCFVITQQSDRYAPRGKNPYLAAKAPIVNADIAAQGVTIDVLRQPDEMFRWSIQSIALQVYAKLGNVPYVLHDPDGTAELVIGIGRHDIHLPGEGFQKQMFGAAAAFRQDGDFLFAGSTAPVADRDDYQETLTKLVRGFVERFEREQATELRRLVLHVFKRTGPREAEAVAEALDGRNIPFALVHVNRDTPLWLVSDSGLHIAPAPAGSVVSLGDDDQLLMTGEYGTSKRRNPHPLRLSLDRRSTFRDMSRITSQAQGFTATSWRGFRTTYEPSTILYGRLLAEKVAQLLPYGFDPQRAAAIGDRPWFL